jgi:MurE/MurF fusion protein
MTQAVDQQAMALGVRLREQSPGGRMLANTSMLTPLDWYVLRPGQRHGLHALLEAAESRQPFGLVYDSAHAPAVATWLEGRPSSDWAPHHVTLDDLAARSGWLASGFHGDPSSAMGLVAITGTNGKSSVVHGLAEGLARLGLSTASIGTLGVTRFEPSASASPAPAQQQVMQGPGLTSLDAVDLQEVLARLRDLGVTWVFLEASSIGLVQGRLAGCRLRAAGVTNLSHEHLDIHGTMTAYAQAKALLMRLPGISSVVAMEQLWLATDEPRQILAQAISEAPSVTWVGCTTNSQAAQTLVAESVDDAGLHCRWTVAGMSTPLVIPTWGTHNLENAGLMGGLMLSLGWSMAEAIQVLEGLDLPSGRLEPVRIEDDQAKPMVLIDYAHTPEALSVLLEAMRPLAQARAGRLLVLFGCGGDRDRTKRPLMGAAATDAADLVMLTADNSRSEATADILQDILAGVPAGQRLKVLSCEDRREAIAQLLDHARPADIVLLCGKGHEKTQVLQGQTLAFDEVAVATAALRAWRAPWPLNDLLMHLTSAGLTTARWLVRPDAAGAAMVGVSIDSRRCPAGALFVAIAGERFDGHDFLDAVAARGAVAAVVARPPENPPEGLPLLLVPDTVAALGALAAAWRRAWPGRLVAVTGSNGKTTVKEMIAAVMRAAVGPSASWATPGNLNNAIGLPLSLLWLRSRHQLAVVEIGMNHPGEIAALAAMAAPEVAVVTNAQREHQEFMGSVAACAQENGMVFEAMASGAVAVVPRDPNHEAIWREQTRAQRLIRFGLTDDAADPETDCELEMLANPTSLAPVAFSLSRLSTDHGCHVLHGIQVAGFGAHLARNAAAAAAVGVALGLSDAQITEGLSAFEVVRGRGRVLPLPGGGSLIDDSYNANPDSVRAAMLALSAASRPVAMALGDMGEVGENGPAFHDEVLAYAKTLGIDRLFLWGEAMQSAGRRAGLAASAETFEEWLVGVSDWVRCQQASGLTPTVWVKGSRFMRMERLIDPLMTKDPHDAALSV